MGKSNSLIIICLRFTFSFVYFYLPPFQRKKEIKKRRDASEALTLSRPAAKPQEITLQTMLRAHNASRREFIQFSKQQSILPLRIQISIVHYNLLRAAPFSYMKHCCDVLSYSLNDSLFFAPCSAWLPEYPAHPGEGAARSSFQRRFHEFPNVFLYALLVCKA